MKTIIGGAVLALGLLLASCGGNDADMASIDTEVPKAVSAINVNDPNVVKLSVPTMQCETCVNAITEGVKKVEGAEDVNVDLNTKTVFVKVANHTPEVHERIEKAITAIGYSTETAPRDSAAYANLPTCCQEGGMEKFKAK